MPLNSYSPFALETHGLTKVFRTRSREDSGRGLAGLFFPKYQDVEAVQNLELRIKKGEIVAFLGPNGAGKSTTIKMLTGILEPTRGEARVLGRVPWKERTELAFRVGSVFGQKSQLWFHLPPSESFRLLGAIYEMDRSLLKKRRDELVDRFALGEFFHVPVRKLSLGQRVRCEIAASFLHQPEVLFLDEPTIGLDVVVKQEIRKLLKELNKERGTTILLTSHDIGDIEKICQRAIIIHHGRVVVDEPVRQLKRQAMAKKLIGVRYGAPVNFQRHPGLELLKVNGDSTAAKFQADTRQHRLSTLLQVLTGLGEVEDLTVEDEPLEDLIAQVFLSKNSEEAQHGRP